MSEALKNLTDRLNQRVEQGAGEAAKPLAIIEAANIQISRQEMIELCNSNQNHPTAKVYLDSLKKHGAGDTIVVDQADVRAIIDNKKVVIVSEKGKQDLDGLEIDTVVNRKKLVDFDASERPAPPSPPPTPRKVTKPET